MQKSTYKATENNRMLYCSLLPVQEKHWPFYFPSFEIKEKHFRNSTLILVPARELALQIEQVFKAMGTDFKVSVCYGGHDKKIEVNNLIEAPAVLIGTPGRVVYHLRNNNFDPKRFRPWFWMNLTKLWNWVSMMIWNLFPIL
jgi:hypothetical protein